MIIKSRAPGDALSCFDDSDNNHNNNNNNNA